MTESFQLPDSENQRVYQEEIEPLYFSRTQPTEKPRAVIIGGQPGAGKTRVLSISKREFDNFNVVIVNTDDLRAFHPKFEQITNQDDKLSALTTHPDASAWNQKLLDRSIETKRNILLEGVLKDGEKLFSITKKLKENGYEVVIRILAVHERFSLWGIHK